MKNKVFKTMYAFALAASISATTIAGVVPNTVAIVSAATHTINKGYLDLGEGTASIKVQGNNGQSLAGKQFRLYKLFSAENSVGGESINYTINPVFANSIKKVVAKGLNARDGSSLQAADITEYMAIDYIQSLNHYKVSGSQANQTLESPYSSFRYFVEEVRTQIDADGAATELCNVVTPDDYNAVTFGGLSYGYYLIDEVTANEGTYQAASLCMVNTANPNAQVNIKSDYPNQVVKKVQEDDNQAAVGNSGWNDVADFEIGQTVPYSYESNIPNINGYATYYYAWHDVMSEALTFNPQSVSIKISDSTGKTYTLAKSEYSVIENPGGGDTFKVEVKDIKKIIDTRFSSNINDRGENLYGQKVVVNYTATLNERAADYTGRPGIENDVRLEFSNDADGNGNGETGYTPWDTVVCFTYQLDSTKINTAQRPLEGAKFRLYSDADCVNEVYVQSRNDGEGYTVLNRDALGGTDHTGGSNPTNAVEMSSNTDGNFIIYGLDTGTYYLKETKAPAGYRQLLDPIVVNVSATYTTDRNNYVKGDGATDKTLKALATSAHVKSFYDGKYVEEDQSLTTDVEEGAAYLSVVNKEGQKLPITGSSMMIIMLGAGCVLMVVALGANKRKKKVQE